TMTGTAAVGNVGSRSDLEGGRSGRRSGDDQPRGQRRVWSLLQGGEGGERIDLLQMAGAEHAGDPLQGLGSAPVPVAAVHLAVDHYRSQALLGPPVGRLDARLTQEGEEGMPLVGQVLEQSPV